MHHKKSLKTKGCTDKRGLIERDAEENERTKKTKKAKKMFRGFRPTGFIR